MCFMPYPTKPKGGWQRPCQVVVNQSTAQLWEKKATRKFANRYRDIFHTIFKKCHYVSSLPRVCFPLYPFSTILQGTMRTDIFVEVVNLASAEVMWAHFTSVAVHPSQLRITGYPRAYDMHIIKLFCCRQLQIDWQNIVLCALDRNIIKLPALGKISLWSTNDLESIETNIPYQIRVYGRVLDLVIPLEIKDDVNITDHRLY